MMKDPVVGVVLPNDPHASAQPNVYAAPAPYGAHAASDATPVDGVALYEFPDCDSSCMTGGGGGAGVPSPAAQTTMGRLKSMFRVKGYKDVPAALAFGGHLIAVVATAAYTASHYDMYVERLSVVNQRYSAASGDSNSNTRYTSPTNGAIGDGWPTAAGLVGALALGVCAIAAALAMLKRNAYAVIVGGQVLCLGLFVLSALSMLAAGSLFGLLFLGLAVLAAIGVYHMRARMRLAAVLLSNAVRIAMTHWGTLVVAMGSVCVLFVYLLVWVAALVVPATPILEASSVGVAAPAGASMGMLGLAVAVYWTSAVSHYVAHVTSSGVAATWYFAGAQLMPPKASAASLKRAMTTSFGSICLGGLFLAIVRVLSAIVRSQTENSNEFVRCFARCMMDMLERAVQYFNLYAFTHVAIYGDSYVAAASRTWNFIKDSWLQALWNDCFVSDALMLLSLGMTMFIGLALALADASVGTVAFAAVFTIGATQIVFGVLTSTVVTLFVCLAQEPQAIHLNNHVFAQELSAALTGCGVQTHNLDSSYTV